MNTKTEYLPLNLFDHFTNLERIYMIHEYTKMLSPKNGHFLLANKLKEIVFVNQRFEELTARVFEGCSAIETILLDNNEISTLDEATFAGLGTLQTLSLSSNEITALPLKIFSSLKGLTTLDLSSNMLSMLASSAFDSNQSLKTLKLDRNRFINIPALQTIEEGSFDFTDSICIDRLFFKTSELNAYNSAYCNIDKVQVFDLFSQYRNQQAINEICSHKNMTLVLEKELFSLEQKKSGLRKEKDSLDSEILKIKIYKNAMC